MQTVYYRVIHERTYSYVHVEPKRFKGSKKKDLYILLKKVLGSHVFVSGIEWDAGIGWDKKDPTLDTHRLYRLKDLFYVSEVTKWTNDGYELGRTKTKRGLKKWCEIQGGFFRLRLEGVTYCIIPPSGYAIKLSKEKGENVNLINAEKQVRQIITKML